MKKNTLTLCALVIGLAGAVPALARLPTPELTPEAKAKAAEAAARTAWSAKVDAYQLCLSQDRVAASYRASAAAAGKQLPPAPAMLACADPGPFAFVEPPAEQKPIEAAGAHSPPATAATPYNTTQPAATLIPTPKQ